MILNTSFIKYQQGFSKCSCDKRKKKWYFIVLTTSRKTQPACYKLEMELHFSGNSGFDMNKNSQLCTKTEKLPQAAIPRNYTITPGGTLNHGTLFTIYILRTKKKEATALSDVCHMHT